jgi:hypothetical protein
MDHVHVIEAVNERFVEGWNRARSAHLSLSINPLNGLSNIIEELVCEEYGWDHIDREVLLPFLTDPERFHDLESKQSAGESLEASEAIKLSQLRNRALGEYGKTISETIKERHAL